MQFTSPGKPTSPLFQSDFITCICLPIGQLVIITYYPSRLQCTSVAPRIEHHFFASYIKEDLNLCPLCSIYMSLLHYMILQKMTLGTVSLCP